MDDACIKKIIDSVVNADYCTFDGDQISWICLTDNTKFFEVRTETCDYYTFPVRVLCKENIRDNILQFTIYGEKYTIELFNLTKVNFTLE